MTNLPLTPGPQGIGAVSLGVADGDWHTVASVGPHLGQAKAKGRINFSFLLPRAIATESAMHLPGLSTITVIDHLGYMDRRIIGVDHAGNEIVPQQGASSPDTTSGEHYACYFFQNDILPGLKVLRLQTRPYKQMEFGGIHLQPRNAPGPSARSQSSYAQADTAAAHIALGLKLQQTGQPRDGIPEFRKAVHIDPNNAEAQEDLAQGLYSVNIRRVGEIYKSLQHAPPSVMDEAIQHEQKAVSLRPNDADWWYNLGVLLLYRNRYTEAIVADRNALRLLPPMKPFLIYGPQTHELNQDTKALIWCHTHGDLAYALLKTRQYTDAVTEYRLALPFMPTADDWLLGLGDALYGCGKKTDARKTWKQILAVDAPTTTIARQARARLVKYP